MKTITRKIGDVTAVELAAETPKGAPGFPPSAPSVSAPTPIPTALPSPPAPPVEIPEGEPQAVALRLLTSVYPGAVEELRARIDQIGRDLGDLVETTRLRRGEFGGFVKAAIPRVQLRRVLDARLAALTGEEAPPQPDVATELHGLIGSIRHFGDRSDVRRHWHIRAAAARTELEGVEADIRSTIAMAGHHRTSDPNSAAHMVGLTTPQDLWLQRMESLLERRRSIRARLSALGEDLAARASTVAAAVEKVGAGELAAAIAGAMPAVDGAQGIRSEIRAIDGVLSGIDPDTRRAAELRDRRAELEAAVGLAAEATEADRLAAASGLIADASTGRIEPLTELERLTRGRFPGLADVLADVLGGEGHFVATLAELVMEHDRRIRDESETRSIMARTPRR